MLPPIGTTLNGLLNNRRFVERFDVLHLLTLLIHLLRWIPSCPSSKYLILKWSNKMGFPLCSSGGSLLSQFYRKLTDRKEVKTKLSSRMHCIHIRAMMIGGVTAGPSPHDGFRGFILNREKLGHCESPGFSRGS
jgi:hypothetical protein